MYVCVNACEMNSLVRCLAIYKFYIWIHMGRSQENCFCSYDDKLMYVVVVLLVHIIESNNLNSRER